MKVLIFNGCWAPNIGNAFVNLGLEVIVKKCFADCEIVYSSDINNKWYFSIADENQNLSKNSFNISAYLNVDLVVWGGMMLTKEFIDSAGEVFVRFSERNIPIMFIGAGADKYSLEEKEYVNNYLETLNLTAIIARDVDTYNMFKDYKYLEEKLYLGIDCAFFLSDLETPDLDIEPYDVECFDRIPTPYIDHENKKIITAHHDCYGILPKRYISKDNTLISELPYDYLTLYKNVDTTYTERIHACIATLAYGNKAQLYSDTKRASLFKQVLEDNIEIDAIRKHPISLDKKKLQLRKDQTINIIRKIMGNHYEMEADSIIQIQPQLLQVYIETISSCNRSCCYCYHSDPQIKSDKKIMSEEVFEKIINDLKARNYSNLIYLYDINEPLLDNRMPIFIKKIAQELPYAKSYIFSNGDLATKDLIREYFDNGLTHFVFSIHDHKNDQKIKEIVEDLGEDKFTIADMTILSEQDFFNRGGSILDPKITSQTIYDNQGCLLPFRQIVINSEGNIRLCCSIHDEVLMDNILNVNIFDYFHNNIKLNEYRAILGNKMRAGAFPCFKCSYTGDNIDGIVQKLGPAYKVRSKVLEEYSEE